MPTAAPEYPADQRHRAPEFGQRTQITETAVEARQGVTGHGVSTVLVVSVVAAVIAMVIVFALFFR